MQIALSSPVFVQNFHSARAIYHFYYGATHPTSAAAERQVENSTSSLT
jgi:hypothetical protein